MHTLGHSIHDLITRVVQDVHEPEVIAIERLRDDWLLFGILNYLTSPYGLGDYTNKHDSKKQYSEQLQTGLSHYSVHILACKRNYRLRRQK